MKLINLIVENLKRIKGVEIHPTDNIIIVGGKNNQGKTSLFDAYQYLIEGKGAQCISPVHEGADRARIVGEFKSEPGEDLGDITVTRTITAAGTNVLEIKTKDGAKYPKPQTILDRIHNMLRDPLAYIKMDRKAQLDLTQKLVGFDFTAQDQDRKAKYDQRTEVNRDAKTIKARIEKMTPYHADAKDKETPPSELLTELRRRQDVNQANEKLKDSVREEAAKIEEAAEEINALAAELEALTEKYNILLLDQEARVNKVNELKEENEEEIETQINNLDLENKKVRDNQAFNEVEKEYKAKLEEADALTAKIEAIDKAKVDALSEVKFPIEGMSFDENGVTYNGLPFTEDQMSTSMMIKVATAMSLALMPIEGSTRLNQIFIYRGGDLDQESHEVLEQLAKEHDAQIFIERVIRNDDDAQECQVIIEDGVVKGVEKPVLTDADFEDI